jgi:PKD repeat protein
VKSKSFGPAPRRRIRVMVAALLALAALFAPGSALADFTASPTTGIAPLTVTFTDATVGATSWAWKFGDGTNPPEQNQQNPTHTYQTPGTYTVNLTTSDGTTTQSATPVTITVLPAPPVSGFSSKTANPHSVAFTDASAGGPTAWRWNFGDAPAGTVQSTVNNPTHAYAAPGSYTVTLSACNAGGCDATPASAIVSPPNRAPKAALTIISDPAAKGDLVAFDAAPTTDADGDGITKYEWAFDSGQFVEGPRVTLAAFNAAGPHYVQLRVTDAWGGTNTTSLQKFSVLEDQAPHPGFSFSPASPGIGQSVTFTSSSFDPDGQISALEWDLDDDGQFDDAQGPVAQWTFATPGSHKVSLRATDDKGVSSPFPAYQFVNVTAPPSAPSPPSSTPAGSPPGPASSSGVPTTTKRVLLSPFPIVRMRARIIGSIIHIDLLSVKAPTGATVQVRCKGRRCPVSRERKRMRKGARSVRFPKLERRLRAGTVLEIFVTKGGAIGTYTRFAFRAGKAPSRRDLCLPAGSMRPGRCPVP